jgi:hypothetical protein
VSEPGRWKHADAPAGAEIAEMHVYRHAIDCPLCGLGELRIAGSRYECTRCPGEWELIGRRPGRRINHQQKISPTPQMRRRGVVKTTSNKTDKGT